MSQPVKTSDELLADARATARPAMDSLATGEERSIAAVPLSQLLADVDTDAGRKRVAQTLNTRPFPHYEPVPGKPGLLFRVMEDGQRTQGRFVGREFLAVE